MPVRGNGEGAEEAERASDHTTDVNPVKEKVKAGRAGRKIQTAEQF